MVGIIIGGAIIVVVVVFMAISRGRVAGGVIQLSHLDCPKCSGEFDYAFLPGGSFTSVRLGNSRYLQCPICHKWSVFNIWNTRVDPKTHPTGHLRVGPS